MTFVVGELAAKLGLDNSDLNAGLDQSQARFENLADAARSAGNVVSAGVKTAIGVTNTAATLTAAWALSVFNTGIQYNTLQQTSRAALQTLLGSAEKVNEQMDKLDAFARTSPFAKQVFLEGQQQLLSFGMQAEKVIPTMKAVQNAVAAAGGSNQQISELIFVLAQIQAAGKITGEDLMQFGQRGVNAAELIGSQMGKTGTEIKESISKGTLDAGAAIDALVAGMDAKFGTAAANVKNTISGAQDRIKAATREIGAAMAEPFVAQSGGGLYVTWANQVADVLQGVRSKMKPIVSILTDEMAPAFALVTNLLDQANVTVRSFNPARIESFFTTVKSFGPAVGLVAGAWAGLSANLLSFIPVVGGALGAVSPLVTALIGWVAVSPELRASLGEVLTALQPLVGAAQDAAGAFAGGMNIVTPVAAELVTGLARAITPLVQGIADLPTPVLAAGLALVGVVANFSKFEGAVTPAISLVKSIADGFKNFGERMAVQASLAAASGIEIGKFGLAAETAGMQVSGLGKSLTAAFISNAPGLIITGVAIAIAAVATAITAAGEAAAKKTQQVNELKDSLSETGEVTDATRQKLLEFFNLKVDEGGALDYLNQLGISAKYVADAVASGGSNLEYLQAKLARMASEKVSVEVQTSSTGGESTMVETYSAEALAAQGLNDKINEQIKAVQEAKAQHKLMEEALREAKAAMTDSERTTAAFNDALAIARDTTQDATTRVNALKQALDILKGGTLSAEQAQMQLSETTLNVADAFARTDANGNKLWQSVLDGAGAININSRAGLDLATTMGSTRDAMLLATQSAFDYAQSQGKTVVEAQAAATEAGNGYIESLRKTLEQAGLTQEQVDGLIGKYLDVPGTVATLLTDEGSIAIVQSNVEILTAKILATPDKTITLDEPNSPGIIQALEDVGFKVKTLPGGRVEVDGSAVDNVSAALLLATQRAQALYSKLNDVQRRELYGSGGSFNGDLFKGGVKAFANGGFASGIYPGVQGGIHKFAEAEMGVPWEAYISGRPSARGRNRELLTRVAGMLGMTMVPTTAATAFADGGMTASSATPTVSSPVVNLEVHYYAAATAEGLSDHDQLVAAGKDLKTIIRKAING